MTRFSSFTRHIILPTHIHWKIKEKEKERALQVTHLLICRHICNWAESFSLHSLHCLPLSPPLHEHLIAAKQMQALPSHTQVHCGFYSLRNQWDKKRGRAKMKWSKYWCPPFIFNLLKLFSFKLVLRSGLYSQSVPFAVFFSVFFFFTCLLLLRLHFTGESERVREDKNVSHFFFCFPYSSHVYFGDMSKA